MKEKKTNGIIELTAKTAFAGLWRNFKEHPIITLGATFQIVGLFLGACLLSGCEKTPKEPVKPPYQQTVPSGEIPSGIPSIGSGDITSGNPQLPSGDITSGDVPPSGEIGSGEEKPEKPTNPTEPEKPAIPGDENYDYPTTMEELEASPDKIKLQQLLTNYIDENLKAKLAKKGFLDATVENTETIAYDIDVENKIIAGFFKSEVELKYQYHAAQYPVNELDLAKIIDFQAKKERNLTNSNNLTITVDMRNGKQLFTIAFVKAENEFQKDAERVYKHLTGENHENAIYLAEAISSGPAFESGFWPLVRITVMYKKDNAFFIKTLNVRVKDFESIGTDHEKEYILGDKNEITFGSETTIFAKDINEQEEKTVIVALMDNEPFAIIDKNQTMFIEQ